MKGVKKLKQIFGKQLHRERQKTDMRNAVMKESGNSGKW